MGSLPLHCEAEKAGSVEMVSRARGFLAVLLLSIVLAFPLAGPVLEAAEGYRCLDLGIPAVESGGGGRIIPSRVCISPGSGVLGIYGVGSVGNDTLASVLVAYWLAQILSGRSAQGFDIYVEIRGGSESVSGPSAGALITLAIYKLLTGSGIKKGLTGTGGIAPDASVEAVGGVESKIPAASSLGYSEFFIPIANYLSKPQSTWSSFRGISIRPVASACALVEDSSNLLAQVLGIDSLGAVSSEAVARGLEDLNASLQRILRISGESQGSRSLYKPALEILDQAFRNPPKTGYALLNTYYLSLLAAAGELARDDPAAAGELAREGLDNMARGLESISRAFSKIPGEADPGVYVLYTLLLDRVLSLQPYQQILSNTSARLDPNLLAPMYARSVSLGFWSELLAASQKGGSLQTLRASPTSLADIQERVSPLVRAFGLERVSSRVYSTAQSVLRGSADPEGLRILSNVYAVYSLLYNYTSSLRAASIEQVLLYPGAQGLGELVRSGYMGCGSPPVESLLGQIYSFSLWALSYRGNLSAGSIISSAISTSSSASTMGLLMMALSGKIYTPSGIVESPSLIMQGSTGKAGGSGAQPQALWTSLQAADLVAAAAAATALAAAIAGFLSRRRSGS